MRTLFVTLALLAGFAAAARAGGGRAGGGDDSSWAVPSESADGGRSRDSSVSPQAPGMQERPGRNAQSPQSPTQLAGQEQQGDVEQLLKDLSSRPALLQAAPPPKKTVDALRRLGSGAAPPQPQGAGGRIPGASGSTGLSGAGADAGAAAQEQQQAIARGAEKGFVKAQRLGEALKGGLRSAEGLPGGGSGGPAGAASSALESGAGADPSEPRTPRELALAATMGFKGAFDALGLKAGRGPDGPVVQEKDGTPASAARLDELAAAIRAEPKALMRRPDFFDVLPREKFSGLKKELHATPDLKAFRHMALSQPDDRDIVRSASCDKLSGGCNAFASASYRKGDYVPPEDLKKLSDRDAGADEPDAAEPAAEPASEAASAAEPGAERRLIDKTARRSIYARLNAVFGGILNAMGAGGGPSVSAAGGGAADAGRYASAEQKAAASGVAVSAARPAPRPGGEAPPAPAAAAAAAAALAAVQRAPRAAGAGLVGALVLLVGWASLRGRG